LVTLFRAITSLANEGHEPVATQDSSPPGDAPCDRAEPPSFDTTIAHPARVYDYLLGGKDNYEADRVTAQQAIAAAPNILAGVRANRAFLRRAVTYLAAEAGIRQFLDIGTGLPTADHTHEVAQRVAPASRIVYADNDPIVLAHGRALLDSTPQGATRYIQADVRDTDAILREAARVLDFSQPVAVLLLLVLQYVPDADQPARVAGRLLDALAPGSYLVISDTTRDIDAGRTTSAVSALNEGMTATRLNLRTHDEIAACFAGLELVDPGLVPVPHWRPDASPTAEPVPVFGGVGQLPASRPPGRPAR
jgi:SAM-dependent methyltransferase